MRSFKTAHHVHTLNSPGDGTVRPRDVIEVHYRMGFDILCITDHNYLTRTWPTATRSITQERLDEISAGVGRGGRRMLQIPNVCEQSRSDHLNTFFVDYVNPSVPNNPAAQLANMKASLAETEAQGGLAHVNHPGRFTNNQSNNQTWIDRCLELFSAEFTTNVGMEIMNKDDRYPNDRILWDNVNTETIPQGRYVYGFSNDDSHRNSEIGWSFNVMFMRKNTLQEFREAMTAGRFYAVARVAGHEGVNNQDLNEPPPAISDIAVTPASIKITAENYDRIVWLTSGGVPVAEGDTIDLGGAGLVVFVRANVIGRGGIAFTQPFGV